MSVNAPVDAPLENYRSELLDLAFRAATKIPNEPHIKDRSSAQESVLVASLELGLPARALRYAEGIDNWRRGFGLAAVAQYCAETGQDVDVGPLLERARAIAASDDMGIDEQQWRHDRVLSKVAMADLAAGREGDVKRFESSADASQLRELATARASAADLDDLDEWLARLDEVMQIGGFEQMASAMEQYRELYTLAYSDVELRGGLLARMEANAHKLPSIHFVGLLLDLAEVALTRNDAANAKALLGAARDRVDGVRWTPEFEVPVRARIATILHGAGDEDAALAALDALAAHYDDVRDSIVNIYRARVLRPIADANQELGRSDVALALYKRTLEEGFVNPNSRPRAEDLAATSTSIALTGLEPDDELRGRMQAIFEALSDPW